jgi:hypothetical protein
VRFEDIVESEDLYGRVDAAQRLHHAGEVGESQSRLLEIESEIRSSLEKAVPASLLKSKHLLTWLIVVRGALLGDVGLLATAERTLGEAIRLAWEFEAGCTNRGTDCFTGQIIEASIYLVDSMNWRSQFIDAARLLEDLCRRIAIAHHAIPFELMKLITDDLDWCGYSLGYTDLAQSLGITPDVLNESTTTLSVGEMWIDPIPPLGRDYEFFADRYRELSQESEDEEILTDIKRIDVIDRKLEVAREWSRQSPTSVNVERYLLGDLLMKAALSVRSHLWEDLYATWDVIDSRHQVLIVNAPECLDLRRQFSRDLCAISNQILTQNYDSNEIWFPIFEFSMLRQFEANNLMEERRRLAPISQAEALVMADISLLMAQSQMVVGNIEAEKLEKIYRARQSIIIDYILKKDSRNDQALELKTEAGDIKVRHSLKVMTELFQTKWKIVPLI